MSVLENTIELVMANFASLDATGQWLARVDNLGFGPIQTPSRVMWNGPRARLLAYDGRGTGAALLIVPAPIKRAYIWDLLPDVSVVQRCLAAGLLVYLLEWTDPDEDDAGLGLDEHIENVISPAIDAVLQGAGRRQTFLAGHSLGGTLAAIASAIQPDRVGGLILIEAPLHFGPEAGALAPMFEMTMRWPAAGFGQRLIPGSFLTLSAVLASPDAFLVAPWFDWLSSTGSHAAVVHLCVQKWVEDELAMPGQLAIDIGDQLYRDDRFAVGTLTIGGKPISPDPLSRIPTLAVIEPSSRLVPRGSALGIFATMPKRALHVFRYRKEVGVAVQHVGALVGRRAHRLLWPKILDWMTMQSETLDRIAGCSDRFGSEVDGSAG